MVKNDSTPRPHRVLMVCLGNICRSPLAEGVFREEARVLGIGPLIEVDSAGTANYHVNDLPDPRSIQVAKENGIALTHRGRQFKTEDFDRFDVIFVMDESNRQNVLRLAQNETQRKKVLMFAHQDPKRTHGDWVKDPYYDSYQAFQEIFEQIQICSKQYLKTYLSQIAENRDPS